MEPLGISEYVTPFWQCFDRFFNYPFKSENLKFILICVLLLMFIPLPDAKEMVTPFSFIFRIIAWILFPSFIVAYLSAVAIKASDGNTQPPSIGKVWSDGGFLILFKALVVMMFFTLLLAFIGSTLGAGIKVFLTLFGALAIPAVMILLFLEREISAAINPNRIVGLMSAIGWPYMFLWGLVMMLISGPNIISSLPESIIDSLLFPYLALLVNLYFGLVLFYLLGYVVYQYHYELGVALPGEEIEDLRKPLSAQRATILESELLIMEGKYHSAIDLLQKFISQHDADNPKLDQVWLKLYEISLVVCDQSQASKITEDYIHFLLNRQQNFKIIAILRSILRKNPEFKISDFSAPDPIEKFLRNEQEIELLKQLN
jgi:hypothetical protein